ncbi:MAG: hypothetical protein ACO1NZ_13140 [Adhaeribacter sp.]
MGKEHASFSENTGETDRRGRGMAGDTKGKEKPVHQTAGWLFKILANELGLIKINIKKALEFS